MLYEMESRNEGGMRELDENELDAIRGGESAPGWDTYWIGGGEDGAGFLD